MKNFLKLAILSTTLASGAIYAEDTAKKPAAVLLDTSIVAEYNGTKVTLKEVLNQFKEVFENQPGMKDRKFEELDKNMKENIIKGYVHTKLVNEEASKAKVQDTKEFKDKLEQVKVQLAQQIYMEKLLKDKVTDADIKAEYDKLKKELTGKEEIKASHILVADEKLAKDLKAKLDKGSSFADMAKSNSTDEGSKANGGELGYFSKGQLVPEFENVAFNLKKGEVSAPVKTQFGWHIIKLEDKRPMKVPTLDEVKPGIQSKLSRETLEQYIANLDKKADVKVYIN